MLFWALDVPECCRNVSKKVPVPAETIKYGPHKVSAKPYKVSAKPIMVSAKPYKNLELPGDLFPTTETVS